jgi:hypothetical protein
VSAIRVGDLVQVVHFCCDVDSELGAIFAVRRVYSHTTDCKICGYTYTGSVVQADDAGQSHGIPTHWLKRIPPLDELERDQIVKELSV